MRLAIVVAAWLIAYALNPELMSLDREALGLGWILMIGLLILFIAMDIVDFSRGEDNGT